MNGFEYLALALALWTAVGLLGLSISLIRRERHKLWQGVGSLVGVWLVYMAVLLVVSYRQPERRVAMGQAECFHTLCITADQAEEIPGFPARNHVRLVRVTLRLVNRGSDAVQEDLAASLRDGQGRRWAEAAAVSGNPPRARVLAGRTMISQPVFQIAVDATGLELELRHGRWSRHLLVIGDPESLGHRRAVLVLDR